MSLWMIERDNETDKWILLSYRHHRHVIFGLSYGSFQKHICFYSPVFIVGGGNDDDGRILLQKSKLFVIAVLI